MGFKFAYFVEFIKGYQPAKFQCCRLSESSFTEELQKHNDDVIMTPFQDSGIRNFHFCETGYKLSTCQVSIPQLSESNFTDVFIRQPKKHYDVIMTSPHNIRLSKLQFCRT